MMEKIKEEEMEKIFEGVEMAIDICIPYSKVPKKERIRNINDCLPGREVFYELQAKEKWGAGTIKFLKNYFYYIIGEEKYAPHPPKGKVVASLYLSFIDGSMFENGGVLYFKFFKEFAPFIANPKESPGLLETHYQMMGEDYNYNNNK